MAEAVDFNLDSLSPSQQESLQQYTSLTNQEPKDAVPLLQRSQWNVQIAITKFFDGEGPDPVAEAEAAAANTPPRISQREENLQESLWSSAQRSDRSSFSRRNRAEPAPRVVPQRPSNIKLPYIFAILLTPVTYLYKLVAHALAFLPASLQPRALSGQFAKGLRNTNGRKMLYPRDSAARFKREFDEEYGTENNLPLFEGGFAQAHDMAKRDLKFLLVFFLSPEHDDTASFVRDTLLAPDVVAFLKDPANNVLVWGGNVLDSEAYQVTQEYNVTKFPFSMVLCRTSSQSGNVGLSVAKRLVGPMTADAYLQLLQQTVDRYNPDLEGLRAERAAQDSTRNLRNEQDTAYERSLRMDRERKRKAQEEAEAAAAAERKAAQEAEAAEVRAQKKAQWRRWRAHKLPSEPAPTEKDVVRLALKMPEAQGGERVTRKFKAGTTIEELYAFVECTGLSEQDLENSTKQPEDYEHVYEFRIASVLPREVYEPSRDITLGERIGKSGNLIVEEILDDDT